MCHKVWAHQSFFCLARSCILFLEKWTPWMSVLSLCRTTFDHQSFCFCWNICLLPDLYNITLFSHKTLNRFIFTAMPIQLWHIKEVPDLVIYEETILVFVFLCSAYKQDSLSHWYSAKSVVIPQGDRTAVKPPAAGWSVSSGSETCSSIPSLRQKPLIPCHLSRTVLAVPLHLLPVSSHLSFYS